MRVAPETVCAITAGRDYIDRRCFPDEGGIFLGTLLTDMLGLFRYNRLLRCGVCLLLAQEDCAAVQGDAKERWEQLCAEAVVEQDPKRLMRLIAEINKLLSEKEQLKCERPQRL